MYDQMKSLILMNNLSNTTIQVIESRSEKLSLKKGDLIISEHSNCEHLYFLISGSIKSFCYDDVKERTTWLYFEEEIFTSWHSYSLNKPSLESFIANEDSTLVAIHKKDVEYLKSNHVDFLLQLTGYYEYSIGFHDHFTKQFPFSSAADNYTFIQKHYPKLDTKSDEL